VVKDGSGREAGIFAENEVKEENWFHTIPDRTVWKRKMMLLVLSTLIM